MRVIDKSLKVEGWKYFVYKAWASSRMWAKYTVMVAKINRRLCFAESYTMFQNTLAMGLVNRSIPLIHLFNTQRIDRDPGLVNFNGRTSLAAEPSIQRHTVEMIVDPYRV